MKIFKLTIEQEIEISENHPLYKDVLAAKLIDQDINLILQHTLRILGLYNCMDNSENYHKGHWHWKGSNSHPKLIILKSGKL